MQVGVGLHMSHARQNLGTLGGLKPPYVKKELGGGKKGYMSSKSLHGGIFSPLSQKGLVGKI